MFSKKIVLSLLLIPCYAIASWNSSKHVFEKAKKSEKHYLLVNELLESGYYFSSLPLLKEYLVNDSKNLPKRMERNLSRAVQYVGLKQLESLPSKYLQRSFSETIAFVLAKKALNVGSLNESLRFIKKISSDHFLYPYAKNLEGVLFARIGKNNEALNAFRICENVSSSNSRNLQQNKDICTAGIARIKFAMKAYNEADLLYLDIEKSSSIWPQILFEEAWNSFYQKNYNRTLGKLVSYKAPVFEYMFNPEVEVLTALSYMKLCLYSDAKKVASDFRDKYWNDFKTLNRLLKRYKKRYSNYYELALSFEQFGRSENRLILRLMGSISQENAYKDLKRQKVLAEQEMQKIRGERNSRFKRFMVKNLEETIDSYRTLIGVYVKDRLLTYYTQLYKAFEGMSYISLETLAQRKAKLYSFENKERSRGDVQYIERNEKQYFWDFNGEFWADELGDYVFALKSEC